MQHLKKIEVIRTDLLNYESALSLQQEIHQRLLDHPNMHGFFIFTQHPSVITIGKRDYSASYEPAYPIVHTDRGGLITAHEPGQLVLYPILYLQKFALSPKSYVRFLEDILIELLASISIEARRISDLAGVWVEDKKIASIGIRIKQRISMHGLALNVSNTLETFKSITPCGIEGCQMTSVNQQATKTYTPQQLIDPLMEIIIKKLDSSI